MPFFRERHADESIDARSLRRPPVSRLVLRALLRGKRRGKLVVLIFAYIMTVDVVNALGFLVAPTRVMTCIHGRDES